MGDHYQCSECGRVHKFKNIQFVSDELFTYIECPYCKKETKQLWVGDREEDAYLYYNNNIDPRYFNYNKTK